jgi:hypothetical protein
MFGEEVVKDAEDVLEVEEEAGGGSEDLESKTEQQWWCFCSLLHSSHHWPRALRF